MLGRPHERAILSSARSSALDVLMLNELPPVNHVVHQLLSSLSISFPLPLPASFPLARELDLERAFLALAFASRCSLNLLGAPSGRMGSGRGPKATERGVERPEDVALE